MKNHAKNYLKEHEFVPNQHGVFIYSNHEGQQHGVNLESILENYLQDAQATNIIELMILYEVNRHIKQKNLTYKLTCVFDGYKYYLMYESLFTPKTIDILGTCEQTELGKLIAWVDLVILKPGL